ncbi:hypothetical protein CCACVL1_07761 [Corchorus capsularis]|uniref:Uncharacterized protein n=1 Tax=Corchorus capsularis TaxID=210143 RepID=A0A1R3J471_COCAP|nr:hypothetical protein CCACVL1_07761 [Corchorus capsularis]
MNPNMKTHSPLPKPLYLPLYSISPTTANTPSSD